MKLLNCCVGVIVCAVLFVGCDAQKKAAEDAEKSAKDAAAKMKDAASDMKSAAGDIKDAAGKMADQAKDKISEVTDQAMENLKVGDVNVGTMLKESLSTLTSKLGEVKDADSAKAALPSFEELAGQLDKISGLTANLPEQAKSIFATLAKNGLGPLKQKIDEVLDMSGVGEVLKPILDSIVEKLNKLAV